MFKKGGVYMSFINTYPGYSAHEANMKEADARLIAEAWWAEHDRREEEARKARIRREELRRTYPQRCDEAIKKGLALDKKRDEALAKMPLLPRTKEEAIVAANAIAHTKEIPTDWQFTGSKVQVGTKKIFFPKYAGSDNTSWYVNLISALIQGNTVGATYYTDLLTREWVWYYTKNPKIDAFNSNINMPEK